MRNAIRHRTALLKEFAQHSEFVRGSITSVCPTCNRARCICRKKPSRRAYRLTYKDREQKTRIVYVARCRLPRMRRMLANYARVRTLMDELIQTNIVVFKEECRQ
jgi:hypothetical protein